MREGVQQLFRVLLAVLIPLASFVTGLGARIGAKHLWRRPRELSRALLAVLIVEPLWVLLLLQFWPVSPAVRAGLLIATISVGIGPVAAVKRMSGPTSRAGDALDLNLVVLLLSMVFVPIAFAALAALYRQNLQLGFGPVAKVVLSRALVPLVIGLGVARIRPAFAAHAAPRMAKAVNIALAILVVVAVAASWRRLTTIGGTAWLLAAVAACGAVLIGHFVGGPDPETREIVAVASVMRFPALSLTLAAALPEQGKRVIPVVIAYVLAAFVAMTLYGLWTRRRTQRRRPRLVVPARTAPRPA
jgi:bile acid:Na+ symporter, BASS family